MQEHRTGLLVIDAQFGPMWDTYKKEETLSVIRNLIDKAKQNSIPIIYTQHEELTGGFLVRGSQFWQFHQEIVPQPEDLIIHKQAADSFYQTSLQEELKKRGITHLVLTGARTEYCVDTTCRAALSLGFDITLVEDGHTTTNAVIPAQSIINHHNLTLKNISNPQRKISVLPSEQITFGNQVQRHHMVKPSAGCFESK